MNMLRKFILPGLLAIACTAVGQNYNAEKVDRPNTKKINIGIKAAIARKHNQARWQDAANRAYRK